jgi:hypothetical protein
MANSVMTQGSGYGAAGDAPYANRHPMHEAEERVDIMRRSNSELGRHRRTVSACRISKLFPTGFSRPIPVGWPA